MQEAQPSGWVLAVQSEGATLASGLGGACAAG